MNIHWKKNIIFTLYLLFNAILIFVLFLFDYGFAFVSFFMIGSHVRDILSIIYQIINMKSIIAYIPEIHEEKNTICCLVPVYAEDSKLVKNNIDSLSNQNLYKNTKVMIFVICDGLNIRKPNNKSLFNCLDDMIEYEDDTKYEIIYETWKTQKETKLFYKVGKYNNVDIILAHKETNLGKKDSLIVGEIFIESIHCCEQLNIEKIDFVYHTDSDTVADENCLNELLKTLVADKNLDGVSGLVRAYYNQDVYNIGEYIFFVMQDFQYFFSLIIRRITESHINTTTCLPGCVNMIRINEKSSIAIDKYANLPKEDTNFLQTVTRMQGTDRRYTTLLLKQGANLKMNWRAFVYTEPPLNARSFINQRRRWSSNAFFNSCVLLYSQNIPFYIKVSNIIDIGRLFSTIFRLVSYFSFWIFLDKFSTFNLILFGLFLIFPYVYIFIWIYAIIPEWRRMFIGFIINKIYMPFLSCFTISKMYLTSTNFAWGNEIKKIKDKIEDSIEDIKEECVELDIISESDEKLEIVIR